MAETAWQWAPLSEEQLHYLKVAEQSLGADVLLAFQAGGDASEAKNTVPGLQAAELSESQLECLQGTEAKLSAVVVAYKQTA